MKKDDDNQAQVTDDAELAKVLEGMNGQQSNASLPTPVTDGLQFEESPLPSPVDGNVSDQAVAATPADTPVVEPTQEPQPEPTYQTTVEPVSQPAQATIPSEPVAPSGLDGIKNDALSELRPLIDKLSLPADEKFDTLLLIIRSTDDQSLIAAAHETAKSIENETKRAQALLDVIKEIDYFNSQAAQ